MQQIASTGGAPINGQDARHQLDSDFVVLQKLVQQQFQYMLENSVGGYLYQVIPHGDLFTGYLAGFDEEHRQHHNCNCCKDFLRKYGNLVGIDKAGHAISLWDISDEAVPALFKESVRAMYKLTRYADIDGVFKTDELALGVAKAGGFDHFFLGLAKSDVNVARGLDLASVQMAKLREDYRTLSAAVFCWKTEHLEQAVNLLKGGTLYRAEKVLGHAEWFLNLHCSVKQTSSYKRDNLIWQAVASAPAGFCTPRSGMLGSLLDDISAGLEFADIKARFNSKMDPLKYQRAQVAPSAGNIQAADKLVEQMGIKLSLERRYARLDEVKTIWRPVADKPKAATSGVFAHIEPKGKPAAPVMQTDSKRITWQRFRSMVLPGARKLEFWVPNASEQYCAMLTARHDDAPPIIAWDSAEQRNPFSTYVYSGGSRPENWHLTPNQWVSVAGITEKPHMWYRQDGQHHNHEDAVLLILDGAKDKRNPGLGLFPEILKSELNPIRSTIEAYSNAGQLDGSADASACGLMLFCGEYTPGYKLRVTTDTGVQWYTLIFYS